MSKDVIMSSESERIQISTMPVPTLALVMDRYECDRIDNLVFLSSKFSKLLSFIRK